MEVTRNDSAGGGRDDAERLAEEFLGRLRRGEGPTIEEYVAAHPALAAEIRELFTTLLFVEELGVESVATKGAAAPAGHETPRPAPELQQVGEYRILREIGRGGMGVVYEAEQASLGRRVALKVLPFHVLLDAKRLERFRQEARAAAHLSHPNIVPVYGVGEHLGLHYYVMQLIPGQGLNRVIEEVRRQRQAGGSDGDAAPDSSSSLAAGLETGGGSGGRDHYFNNVARLARDAALALDYAHGEGILHRDVKPSNLLLDPGGRVWLTDFGLSKAEGTEDLTQTGDFVGTALFMAPERFKGWSDPRSDVYGLGVTLYELVTLRPIFVERDRAQLLRKVATEEPPAPRRLDRSIPRDLETIVLKAIAKEPSQRYASARAMGQDLERFLDGMPVEARRSHALERLGRWCARNPLLSTLAASVLMLLTAVAVVSSALAARLVGEQAALIREQAAGQEKLRAAYLAEASAVRASVRPGRRFLALETLQKAAEIRQGPDLVDEALASFAIVDLRSVRTWRLEKYEGFALSPDGSVAALALPGGETVLRAASDQREIGRLPAPGFPATFVHLKFSQSGRFLAIRHEQGKRTEWGVWDVNSRRLCVEVKDAGHDDWLDFSPDGRWVIVSTRERVFRVFDLATGAVIQEIGRGLLLRCVAVHPGGRLIAFASDHRPRKVYIHDLDGGQMIRALAAVDNLSFEQLAWHPDGKLLAASNMDHLIYVWNAETGELLRTLRGHAAQVTSVSFSPRGDFLVSGGWEPAVRFWDPAGDVPLLSIHQSKGYFLRDLRSCWTLGADRDRVEWWELPRRLPAFTLFGHDGRLPQEGAVPKHPHSVALAPGGRLAASAGDDGVRLWDLAARTEIGRLGEGRVMSVDFGPEGKALYTSGAKGIHRWPLRPLGEGDARIAAGPAQRLTGLESCHKAALGNGGRTLAAIHEETHAHVIDPDEPTRSVQLLGLPPRWISMAVSRDGAWLAAGCLNGEEAWLWAARDGRPRSEPQPGSAWEPERKLPVPRARVQFHPASTHLATCSPRTCTLWRLEDGEPVWRIEREPGLRYSSPIAFSEDGRLLAVTYSTSRIWVLEAMSGKRLFQLDAAEPLQVNGLAMSSGRLVAIAPTRHIHVWDLHGLARDVADLGLEWEVPVTGRALEDLPPLRVSVLREPIDLLADESSSLAPRELFRPSRLVAFQPQLASFGEIDQALATPSLLIPEGERWKYFRGRAEPSPGMEWTSSGFDDSRWEAGQSPLTGYNQPATEEGTWLNDQFGGYTTLYARRTFEVADPKAISRLVLAAEVEDGFIAHLNGQEVGRVRAGKPGERMSFQALAERTLRPRVTEALEIEAGRLEAGKNVLALQVLSYGLDSRLHILPVLAGVPAADAERERNRTENLFAGQDGAPDASLAAYREGRILQRAGRPAEALRHFERAGEVDRGSAEPLLRRIACHRALGEPAVAESLSREAIEQGDIVEGDRLWRAWLHAVLVDPRRPPTEALASLPRDPRRGAASADSAASGCRWLLEELAASKTLRLNCGGGDHQAKDGKRWSRDRFFLSGVSSDKHASSRGGQAKAPGGDGDDAALHGIERWFPGPHGTYSRGYSIPLPPGRYRVSLHFVESTYRLPGGRVFDVLLEGKVVLAGYDPVLIGFTLHDIRTFDVEVVDGAIEIDFLSHREAPRLAALEVEATGALQESAGGR
ncbi:MAG: protein kinase [Planctomycetes bacterium]|nr:protein kinase [Planctomycetota bacterium]